MSSVSKNIKKMRIQRKLTQEDMANKLFVTRQTISNWENGKSQPDLDMLIKIASILDTEITVLIYGLPDSNIKKKETKHLIIAGSILLVLSIGLFFLIKLVDRSKIYYSLEPMIILQAYYLPIFWLVLGWTIMQFFSVLGVVKQIHFKFKRVIRIAACTFVLLYFILLIPYLKEMIINMVNFYHFNENPSIYGNSYQSKYNIPTILMNIEGFLISTVFKRSVVFIIPSILFWLSKPTKLEQQKH